MSAVPTATEERRQFPRGIGLIKLIEDVTYSTLRKMETKSSLNEPTRPHASSE